MLPIYPFMIEQKEGMPNSAATGFAHNLKRFGSLEPDKIAENSGSVYDPGKGIISLASLGRNIGVSYPQGDAFFMDGSGLQPVWGWRYLLIHYLGRADNTPLSGDLITYRETEHGQVFYSAFYKTCILPLVERLAGEEPEKIKRACADLGAVCEDTSDITAVFSLFPRFPVTVKIWLKDEELPGSANILLDSSANHYMHTEDIALAGELVVKFLIEQVESY
ncbi:MAG: DUF3786 domain-containing protein [Thermacetogeniaceae bacterium]|nr:DUF3786 domain-containing protein [Syntrophomonadaceae bacterium]